jgi:hypothetical protein
MRLAVRSDSGAEIRKVHKTEQPAPVNCEVIFQVQTRSGVNPKVMTIPEDDLLALLLELRLMMDW